MSTAQTDSILVKTSGGYSIYSNFFWSRTTDVRYSSDYVWTGECADGFAQGTGILQFVLKSPSELFGTTKINASVSSHRGRIFGFVKSNFENTSVEASFSGAPRKPKFHTGLDWFFVDGERVARLSGLGLDGSDSLLANAADVMPTRTVRQLKSEERISLGLTPGNNISLLKVSCDVVQRLLPDCGGTGGRDDTEIYVFLNKSVWTPCPQPLNLSSCTEAAIKQSSSLVSEIEQFIKTSMSRIIETQREMQAVLAGLNASKAQAKIEVDNTNARFDASLNAVSVGELFALADEYKSKADLVRARTALRKLISRFPEHRLAKLSADMLIDLQGK